MSGDMPPPSDLPTWVLWAFSVAVTALSGAIATLWKVSESKNAKDIVESRDQLIQLRAETAAAKAETQTEIRILRDEQKQLELARLECEKDRARLSEACKMMTSRIENLEAKNNRDDT